MSILMLDMENKIHLCKSIELKNYFYLVEYIIDNLPIDNNFKTHVKELSKFTGENILNGLAITAIRELLSYIDYNLYKSSNEIIQNSVNEKFYYIFENNISHRIKYSEKKLDEIDNIWKRYDDMLDFKIKDDSEYISKINLGEWIPFEYSLPLMLKFDNTNEENGYLNLYSSKHIYVTDIANIHSNDENLDISIIKKDIKEFLFNMEGGY